MKFLLIAIGSHGDVHPFVGMGLALQRRGHDVTIATNGHFESLVRNVGLEFSELGTDEKFRELIKEMVASDLAEVEHGSLVDKYASSTTR